MELTGRYSTGEVGICQIFEGYLVKLNSSMLEFLAASQGLEVAMWRYVDSDGRCVEMYVLRSDWGKSA